MADKKSFETQVLTALGTVQQSIGKIDVRLDKLDGRTDKLETSLYRVEVLQEETRDDISKVAEGMTVMNEQLPGKASQASVNRVGSDVLTIQKAVRATNLDLAKYAGS